MTNIIFITSSPISQSALVIRADGDTFKIWVASLGASIDQSKNEVPEGTKEGDWLSIELDDRGIITQIRERSALLPSFQPDERDELKVWDWFVVDTRYRKAYSRTLGFLDLSTDFAMPPKEKIDSLSFNLYAVVRSDRLVIPKQLICEREGDEKRRVRLAQQLRIEIDNSPEMKNIEKEFNLHNGREITNWMPVLITGTYQRLYFFSSRVGDGIISPSLINAHSAIRIGVVFDARIEKIAASAQYPRGQYKVVNLSPSPVGLPMEVTIDVRSDEIQLTTIVRVEEEQHQNFLLSCDLVGKCFISKPDVYRDRPIFIGQRIRVVTRRIKNGPTNRGQNNQPSHWKVYRYEYLNLRQVEKEEKVDKENKPVTSLGVLNRGEGNGSIQERGVQRNVRNLPSFGSAKMMNLVKNEGIAEKHSLPTTKSGVGEGNASRQSSNEQTTRRLRSKSSSRGRVTTIMSRLIHYPQVIAAIQRNDRRRGTRSYERIVELLK